MISSNVASLVETPKLHEQAILRLEPNEVATSSTARKTVTA